MRYILIGFKHNKGEFETEGKKIEYNNYKLRLTRQATEEEIEAGNEGEIYSEIKITERQMLSAFETEELLSEAIGLALDIETIPTKDGKYTYIFK